MPAPDFVEYIPEETRSYTRPETVMVSFPKSIPGQGFGISVDEFREFVQLVKAGAYDQICEAADARL